MLLVLIGFLKMEESPVWVVNVVVSGVAPDGAAGVCAATSLELATIGGDGRPGGFKGDLRCFDAT